MEATVVVGRITKVHGLKGEVIVQVFSDNPERFADGAKVFTVDGRTLTVLGSRDHSGRLVVTFEQARDRTAAEALQGADLVIPESMLPELPEGEYWPHQLVGCDVITDASRRLGTLTDVIPNPANDLWVAVNAEGAETLVPALKDVIITVDLEAKKILVRDIPGLTAPADDESRL